MRLDLLKRALELGETPQLEDLPADVHEVTCEECFGHGRIEHYRGNSYAEVRREIRVCGKCGGLGKVRK